MARAAKKYLGQHWLRSTRALNQIIAAGDLHAADVVLEIGPGRGVLTRALLDRAGQVIAIEKDRDLITDLKQQFATEIKSGKLVLLSGDILDFDLSKLTKLQATSYKLISNIPYYLTGQIMEKFLTAESAPRLAVLLLQKAVAERIVARDGKESILSISVKAYGQPKIIAAVKAGSFTPPPKVDSAILLVSQISKNFFRELSEKKFFTLIKQGFAHKRKQLAGNLKLTAAALDACHLDPRVRAENLSLADWRCLYRQTNKL